MASIILVMLTRHKPYAIFRYNAGKVLNEMMVLFIGTCLLFSHFLISVPARWYPDTDTKFFEHLVGLTIILFASFVLVYHFILLAFNTARAIQMIMKFRVFIA